MLKRTMVEKNPNCAGSKIGALWSPGEGSQGLNQWCSSGLILTRTHIPTADWRQRPGTVFWGKEQGDENQSVKTQTRPLPFGMKHHGLKMEPRWPSKVATERHPSLKKRRGAALAGLWGNWKPSKEPNGQTPHRFVRESATRI